MSTTQSPQILQTTKLNRPWLAKMIIFCSVLVFFGFYGLYDALIAYPARGMRYASFQQYQYLDLAKANGLLGRNLSIADPEAERVRLLQAPGQRTNVDQAKLAWLDALDVVGNLDAEHTKIDDPAAKHAQLTTEWTTQAGTKKAPKALARLDIPMQWVFVAIGFGGGLALIGLFLSVARQRYSWDAATQTLVLPDGGTLTPADIEEFDKRKWDKFLVFLRIRPEHPTLGGREIKVDLYRYTPLESWVLEMEKTAFPDSAQPEAVAAGGAEPGTAVAG